MVTHNRTAPLLELVKLYDAAPLFVKQTYGREIIVQLVAVCAELCHAIERLGERVEALEHFPETR